MVSAKESFEPDHVYCANSQLRKSAQTDCFRKRCFASFDQVQGGVEEIPVWRLGFPAESGGGKPRVRLEFCGEIEHGTVSELSCDAFDGPVSLGQQ